MSKAEELLNGIPEDDISLYTADPASESLIVINSDRTITVPAELKRIAVQYDHNIETVTFQCPRYWDGHDMSEMVVYINYKLPDNTLGCYVVDNVTVDESNDGLMYFDWTVSRNVTQHKGNISFLVCIKKVDQIGYESNHWNSELNKDLYISEGLECEESIVDEYPDVLTQILMRLDAVEKNGGGGSVSSDFIELNFTKSTEIDDINHHNIEYDGACNLMYKGTMYGYIPYIMLVQIAIEDIPRTFQTIWYTDGTTLDTICEKRCFGSEFGGDDDDASWTEWKSFGGSSINLTFDDAPTEGSKNLLTSGTIYNALENTGVDVIERTFANENIYDEEMNSVPQGTEFRIGTVQLNGTEQTVVISTKGGSQGYITDIKIYDGNDVEIPDIVTSSAYNENASRSGKIVPVATNAKRLEFKYRFLHASTGNTLCSEMMVTIGTIVPRLYVKCKYVNILKNSPYVTTEYCDKVKTLFVAINGNDENDGLSKETALASIEKAISLGAREIAVEVGEYFINTTIRLSNLSNVHIYAFRSDETYAHTSPIRDKVKFIGGTYYTNYSLNADGVYQQANVTGFDFNNVFNLKIKTPEISSRTYHANVMVLHDDRSDDYYLKPVLTYNECVSTDDSFYWDGSTLFFNPTSTNFVRVAAIAIESGLMISNSKNIIISDVCFSLCKNDAVRISNSSEITLNNCEGNASATSMGFSVINSNVIINNCYATKNAFDGFNFHGYGTSVMNDCLSENNYDDGCSHHDGCIGTINGGLFIGNGKAGIAPAYGANVNIYNSVCEGNHIGIGYLTTENGHANMKGIVSGCLLKNNNYGLLVNSRATVTAIGCEYVDNTTDKQGI